MSAPILSLKATHINPFRESFKPDIACPQNYSNALLWSAVWMTKTADQLHIKDGAFSTFCGNRMATISFIPQAKAETLDIISAIKLNVP